MDRWLAGFIALAFVLALTAQLTRGQVWLYFAPKPWQFIDKRDDPGRFWAFVVAEMVVLVVVIMAGISGAE